MTFKARLANIAGSVDHGYNFAPLKIGQKFLCLKSRCIKATVS